MNRMRLLRERARPQAIRPNGIRLGRRLGNLKALRRKRRGAFRHINPAVLIWMRDSRASLR
jgi:hypothetical protein